MRGFIVPETESDGTFDDADGEAPFAGDEEA